MLTIFGLACRVCVKRYLTRKWQSGPHVRGDGCWWGAVKAVTARKVALISTILWRREMGDSGVKVGASGNRFRSTIARCGARRRHRRANNPSLQRERIGGRFVNPERIATLHQAAMRKPRSVVRDG